MTMTTTTNDDNYDDADDDNHDSHIRSLWRMACLVFLFCLLSVLLIAFAFAAIIFELGRRMLLGHGLHQKRVNVCI